MISFVIPAYDEEALLPATLRALAEAAQPLGIPFEVIVVNDASTDRTGEVARSCGARVIDVRHRQIAATRNTARERQGATSWCSSTRTRGSAQRWSVVWSTPSPEEPSAAAAPFASTAACRSMAAGGFDEGLFGAEEAIMSRALRRHGRFVVLREAVITYIWYGARRRDPDSATGRSG